MKHEKSEKIYDAITDIRDDLVESAEKKKPRRRRWWPAAVAAVLAVAIAGGVILWPDGSPLTATAYAVAEAQYPQMAPYPNEMDYTDQVTGKFDNKGFSQVYDAWRTDRRAQLDQPEGYADGWTPSLPRASGSSCPGRRERTGCTPPERLYGPGHAGRADRRKQPGARSWTCWAAAASKPCGSRPAPFGTPITATTARPPACWQARCG